MSSGWTLASLEKGIMSNPFAGWTAEMVNAHNERVARGATKPPNGETIQAVRATKPLNVETIDAPKKPLLNKTETLWKAELERRGHKIILVQAVTLRLGDRLSYRPDLATVDADVTASGGIWPGFRMTCYETKAPHRFATAGVTKIKAAAKQYPFIRFVLVMRDKGQWTEREIGSE